MNLFISYAWKDGESVNGFKGLLGNPNTQHLDHNDESVKHDFSASGVQAIKDGIERKIRRSDITVCLISQRTWSREWVNWELEKSHELGKPVLGIIMKGEPLTPDKGMPEFFTRRKQYKIIPWSSPEKLDEAIKNAVTTGSR